VRAFWAWLEGRLTALSGRFKGQIWLIYYNYYVLSVTSRCCESLLQLVFPVVLPGPTGAFVRDASVFIELAFIELAAIELAAIEWPL